MSSSRTLCFSACAAAQTVTVEDKPSSTRITVRPAMAAEGRSSRNVASSAEAPAAPS